MPTLDVGDALSVAAAVSDRLPENTSRTARELYRVLVAVGVETMRGRGHSPNAVEVVFHLPLERLADVAGISRITAWRHLPALRALGVVDYRTHKASCRGETRNSGTVWRVRLTPVRGCKARVSYADLKHRWRDLDRDVRSGRTSYAERRQLKHTKTPESKLLKIESLLTWTLPRHTYKTPDMPVCFSGRRVSLESVLDVQFADRDRRGAAVDLAAQAMATALRDATGLDYYRRLLWQLLRRSDATGQDYSYPVYLAAQRAAVDDHERFARKPGALFVSRLRAAPWFDEVMNGPPIRVALRPT